MNNYYFCENSGFLGYKMSTTLLKNYLTTVFVAQSTNRPIKTALMWYFAQNRNIEIFAQIKNFVEFCSKIQIFLKILTNIRNYEKIEHLSLIENKNQKDDVKNMKENHTTKNHTRYSSCDTIHSPEHNSLFPFSGWISHSSVPKLVTHSFFVELIYCSLLQFGHDWDIRPFILAIGQLTDIAQRRRFLGGTNLLCKIWPLNNFSNDDLHIILKRRNLEIYKHSSFF